MGLKKIRCLQKRCHMYRIQVASVCAHYSLSCSICSICSPGNSDNSWGWNCCADVVFASSLGLTKWFILLFCIIQGDSISPLSQLNKYLPKIKFLSIDSSLFIKICVKSPHLMPLRSMGLAKEWAQGREFGQEW